MRAHNAPTSRAGFLNASGVLLVLRDPPAPPPPAPGQPPMVPGNPAEGVEILLALWDDGSANGLAGKVDLGTGVATALGQLVAEELGLPFAQVVMLLGDTTRAPNQGPTIASATLQIAAEPLRRAAAQAGAWLRDQAAGNAAALQGRQVHLMLDLATPLKPQSQWQVAGQPVPRVDIPAKVLGESAFVHDLRLPGMLHGRVVRPPYAGADHGPFIGHTLQAVDESSVAHIPGLLAVVREGDFVGVVAEREEQAEAAMQALRLQWADWPGQPAMGMPDERENALRNNPATPRVVAERGDAAAANAAAPLRLQRRYLWPYQLHASIGPSCAVAHWQGSKLSVWAGTQNPHVLRADLALLTGLADTDVDVVRLEAAGCYGRNGADDVAADAALLSRAVGRPVRVQLTREQEHQWEPKGAAQLMDVEGSVNASGQLEGWAFETCYPSNAAPTLALLLTGRVAATAQAYAMGDRTSVPPYRVPNLKVTVHDMPPILRASWLRGVSALPNSFAHESFIDELAHAQGADPLAFRLQHLDDPRAAELLRATAERAGWQARRPAPQAGAGQATAPDAVRAAPQANHSEAPAAPKTVNANGVLKGQGLAYARYIHSKFPGFGAAWSAWVADVEVNPVTGDVHVSRVVVGHDAGAMVNPAGVQHQVHGNVVQTTSRALIEEVKLEPTRGAVSSRDWGSYPILSLRQVPVIDVLLMPRPDEPMLGAGESASVPGTAAIANAIFDATGVRLRQPPFTPEVVRAALQALPSGALAAGAGAQAGAGAVHTTGAAGETGATAWASTPATAFPPSAAPGAEAAALSAMATAVTPQTLPAATVQRLPRAKPLWARAAALLTGTVAAVAGLVGISAWRPAIAPITGVNAGAVYTAATIERGRQVAAVANCAGCHTVPGGAAYAGGRAIETPFGTVYSTNLTPDAATGIGAWSFSAFQRALREGVSRDGHLLYPAFPYTAFTRMGDDDLTALYAYLMAQPAVHQPTPPAQMQPPFNLRPLMALWNALHLSPGPRTAAAPVRAGDPMDGAETAAATAATSTTSTTSATAATSTTAATAAKANSAAAAPTLETAAAAATPALQPALWQRGEYLVNGPGHCGACHSPRSALGAESTGAAALSGAWVDGWQAPSLTAAHRRTLAWDETSLFNYLREGQSAHHGVAVGPMAEVVQALAGAPDEDLRAMAHYLASLQGAAAVSPAAWNTPAAPASPSSPAAPSSPFSPVSPLQQQADAAIARARGAAPPPGATQRSFEAACGACHSEGRAAVELGNNLPLALNSKLRADSPDNLLRVLLDGIQQPARPGIGFMPAFRHSMDDAQLAEMAQWLRRRYAPDHAPWPALDTLRQRVAQLRGAPRSDR